MEFLFWAVIVSAVVVGGIIGYCQYQQRADAKLQAAVDEYNTEVDNDLAQRAWQRNEHPKRIDDAQWRDWN